MCWTLASGAGGDESKPDPARFDVSAVHLPGEEDMSVPVYDTCDVVRKKLATHLAQPGMTQAQFLRDAAAAAIPNEEKKLSSRTLGDFRSKHGANAGATSSNFYAAYVFFEKLRARDGKPKSKFREEMEKVWLGRGMDLDVNANTHYFCFQGQRPHVDKYGQVRIG